MPIEKIKRKKGYVYKAVFNKNKVRTTKSFERKLDAQEWLKLQEQKYRSGFSGKVTFFKACDTWFNNHSLVKKTPNSQRGDKYMIEKVFKPTFGDVDLLDISTFQIDSLIANLCKNGITHCTINRYLQCLKTILNYYVKRGYLFRNVVSIVGLLPEKKNTFDYWSFEDAEVFLNHAYEKYKTKDQYVYALYLLAINTGMRWGEIIGLKWDKVDFKTGLITISRSFCATSKEIVDRTKGHKIRQIKMNSALLPVMERLCAKSVQRVMGSTPSFSKNNKPLQIANFKRDHFNVDLKESNVVKIRFHDIRHTFASHFVMRGGSLYDLQKLLGHSDIRTTERYAHLSPEHVSKQVELIAIEGGRSKVIKAKDRFQKVVG